MNDKTLEIINKTRIIIMIILVIIMIILGIIFIGITARITANMIFTKIFITNPESKICCENNHGEYYNEKCLIKNNEFYEEYKIDITKGCKLIR